MDEGLVRVRDIRIGDKVYANAKEAAEAENCTTQTIYRRAREGDTSPLRARPGSLVYKGKRFTTGSALARFLGVSTQAVYKARDQGRLDELGQTSRYRVGQRKEVDLWGAVWPALALAASELDVSASYIGRVLAGKETKARVKALRDRVAECRPETQLRELGALRGEDGHEKAKEGEAKGAAQAERPSQTDKERIQANDVPDAQRRNQRADEG